MFPLSLAALIKCHPPRAFRMLRVTGGPHGSSVVPERGFGPESLSTAGGSGFSSSLFPPVTLAGETREGRLPSQPKELSVG